MTRTRTQTTERPTRPTLRGAFTALVTPFTANGLVDEAAFRRLVRWQVLAGIDGLVPGCASAAPAATPIASAAALASMVRVI